MDGKRLMGLTFNDGTDSLRFRSLPRRTPIVLHLRINGAVDFSTFQALNISYQGSKKDAHYLANLLRHLNFSSGGNDLSHREPAAHGSKYQFET